MGLPKFLYQFLKKATPINTTEPVNDIYEEIDDTRFTILQIQDGQVVNKFSSSLEAAEYLGDRSKSGNILKVLDPDKPNRSAYGYEWKYEK